MSTQNDNRANKTKKVHDLNLLDPFGFPVYEDEYNAAHRDDNKDDGQKSPDNSTDIVTNEGE